MLDLTSALVCSRCGRRAGGDSSGAPGVLGPPGAGTGGQVRSAQVPWGTGSPRNEALLLQAKIQV